MDNKQERNLVDELAQRNPVLFATYKKTEEVVINHWYPGISANNGSTNSYPHVQGVIQQLSLVVYHSQCAVVLTEAELYLLLTSILLHDIGKVQQGENHGQLSQSLIQSHWAELKIENEQMQRIIQTICLLHDRKSDFLEVYQQLPVDEYIDRYGKVRPRLLGALLYLGDHMDNSYTRTMTQEFTKHFRRSVLGVHFQPEQQLITTVIDPGMFFLAETEEPEPVQQTAKAKGKQQEKKPLSPEQEGRFLDRIGTLGRLLKQDPNYRNPNVKTPIHLDVDSILFLLQDTFDNDQCLRNVWNELYVLGMPIKKWMIECKGQLLLVQKHNEPAIEQSTNGQDPVALPLAPTRIEYHTALSIEPLTGYDYCTKVLAGMYEITSTIFAKSFFSYTDLCNYLREDPNNTRKVMSAVRRLSFLFQHMAEFGEANTNYRYEIYYDDQVWNLKNTVCDRACSLSGSSALDKNIQEPQPSNLQEVCDVRPKAKGEPCAFLKSHQEQGTIADWTKEAKQHGE